MKRQDIADIVIPLFRAKENFKGIALDDDYFELGVSSLTIVGLQIQVEEKVGVTLETRELMTLSTIDQWIDAYAARTESLASVA